MNSVTIEEESGTDKKEDINLVAMQKYFADLDWTSSNMKTSLLEGCGSHPRRGPLLSFKTPISQPNASHNKVAEDIWMPRARLGAGYEVAILQAYRKDGGRRE